MERRSERNDSPRSETIVDARTSLALWLRAGRVHRGMSLDDVAKITKIQPRILERLETGKPEGLPADVFVRGFVRSFARCVGLDEEEALRRYVAGSPGGLSGPSGSIGSIASAGASAGQGGSFGSTSASGSDLAPTARALVEAMADLVPGSATVARATVPRMLAVEVIDLALAGGGPVAGSLAAGSLRDLPASDALVETMMLPETGTVVMPARSIASTSLAEAMTDSEAMAEASAGSAAGAGASALAATRIDVAGAVLAVTGSASAGLPATEPTPAVAVEPAALIRGDVPAAALPTEPARKKRGRRGKGRNKRPTGGAAPAFHRDLLVTEAPGQVSPFVAAPVAPQASAAPDVATARGSAVITAVSVAPVGSDTIPSSAPEASIEASIEGSADPSAEGSAVESPAGEPAIVAAGSSELATESSIASSIALLVEPSIASSVASSIAPLAEPSTDEPIATATWAPRMPPLTTTPSVPWRRPAYVTSASVVVPSLVIDDADPESAERVLEERAEKHAPRRSFLPPILLDREDRSARQGGLTLAVIILLIAATLTLSYLMRRPSAGGDGMTMRETPAGHVGSSARG
jgi:hypothetical protein